MVPLRRFASWEDFKPLAGCRKRQADIVNGHSETVELAPVSTGQSA